MRELETARQDLQPKSACGNGSVNLRDNGVGKSRVPLKRAFRLGFREGRIVRFLMDSADAMRRWLGAFCLTVAAGMLIWGQTLLKPVLDGWLFIVYWTFCFIFTFGAIVIALLDIRALRRRTRREQRELLERTLAEVEQERRHNDQN